MQELMTVEVHLLSQSRPVIVRNAKNTYTKDTLFCVLQDNGQVQKFPVCHIFRITEFAKENL